MDLVAELSANSKTHKDVISLIPLMAEAAHHKHYTQHLHLMETVCTQVNGTLQLLLVICTDDNLHVPLAEGFSIDLLN